MSSKKKERMQMENNPTAISGQGNKFFNGFLLGFLIGGGLMFLLGTKKGKKLLKAISEEGLGSISNILQTEKLDDIDDDEEIENVIPQKNLATEDEVSEAKPRVRRFFRGITKRLN